MNEIGWGAIGLALAGLWVSWIELRLRKAQADLKKVMYEKNELIVHSMVQNMSDSQLNSELSDDLKGPKS